MVLPLTSKCSLTTRGLVHLRTNLATGHPQSSLDITLDLQQTVAIRYIRSGPTGSNTLVWANMIEENEMAVYMIDKSNAPATEKISEISGLEFL